MTPRPSLLRRSTAPIGLGDPPVTMVAAVDAVERRIPFRISLWLMPVRTMSESALGDSIRIHRVAPAADAVMALALFFNNVRRAEK